MSFLLDTNVVSEWTKPKPNIGVIQWLDQTDEDRVFISSITLAELRYGVERLPDGRRRKALEEWLRDQLLERFAGRILPVDETIADIWGKLIARGERSGRRPDTIDGFIAATATVHEFTLVTRNVTDFSGILKSIVNPWT